MNKYDEGEVVKALMNSQMAIEEEQKGHMQDAIRYYEMAANAMQTQVPYAPTEKKPLLEISIKTNQDRLKELQNQNAGYHCYQKPG